VKVASLITPELRARLKALRLSARFSPFAQGIGEHAGRARGAGLEFAQYRAYEPGDEPRHIDWKLYARSDRYFVRDSTRDSPLTVWLLVDATASMTQADAARPDYSKLDAARALAACIAEIALQQNDAFGLVTVGRGITGMPASTGRRHRDQLWRALDALESGPDRPNESALRPLLERIAPASLLVILSDGFDDALVALAERLAAARREVLFIQLISCEERDFPFAGGHVFRDPETGETRRGDAAAMREEFLRRFGEARAALARRLASSGIRHAEHVLDAPLDAPLRRLFGSRRHERLAG
jgi:uncharacterized protein (DUF58 family)